MSGGIENVNKRKWIEEGKKNFYKNETNKETNKRSNVSEKRENRLIHKVRNEAASEWILSQFLFGKEHHVVSHSSIYNPS